MNLTVNQTVLNEILSPAALNNELEQLYQTIIDEEFEKEDMDTDLVDECVDALLALENGDIPSLPQSIIRFCRRKTAKPSVTLQRVAAILIILFVGTAVTFKANPVLAETVSDYFESVIELLFSSAQESETKNSSVSSIYLSIPDDMPLMVKTADGINLSAISVTAVYADATEKEIDLKDCIVHQTPEKYEGRTRIIVTVSYEGCAASLAFETEES